MEGEAADLQNRSVLLAFLAVATHWTSACVGVTRHAKVLANLLALDPRLRGGDDEKGRPVPPVPSFPRQRESTLVARIDARWR